MVPAQSFIRPPAAAGRFYPDSASELAATVGRLLAEAPVAAPRDELRALVAPHAGYAYSGTVAATAFATLPAEAGRLRVALFGPSHFAALRGAAVSGAAGWRTPLGTVSVDAALRDAATAAGAVVDEEPHALDHALEVELPFLQQRVGDGLRVLPVAIGGDAEETAAVIAAVAGDALVVVSTDLSHYHDDATARRLDRRTADAVLALDASAVGDASACGARALRGLLVHARRAGWACTELDLRTSADAAGDRDSVVGYGAFAFSGQRAT
jgi:AmmeMemoRadiSam system protein B